MSLKLGLENCIFKGPMWLWWTIKIKQDRVLFVEFYYFIILIDVLENKFTYTLKASVFLNIYDEEESTKIFKTSLNNWFITL